MRMRVFSLSLFLSKSSRVEYTHAIHSACMGFACLVTVTVSFFELCITGGSGDEGDTHTTTTQAHMHPFTRIECNSPSSAVCSETA